MNEDFKERRMLLLRHELGHWLVARHHKFAVGRIKVKVLMDRVGAYHPDGSSKIFPELTLTTDWNLKEEMIAYLESRMQVLYAGTAAQVIHLEGLSPEETTEILQTDGGSDLRTIQELMPMLLGLTRGDAPLGQSEEQRSEAIIIRIWEETQHVVQSLKEKLFWMASELEQQVFRAGTGYKFPLDELEALERQFDSEAASIA
jgi:hypothetical protein